jgi:hypothetical protein
MSGDTITFDEVLRLARRLSPADQARLRAALPLVADEAAERALQRHQNQAAIDLLDEWLSDTTEYDDLEGGESWEAMLRDMDSHRSSMRKLFPNLSGEP